jgi:putative transposase
MMLVGKQTDRENSMTHINFTLELEQVQELIEKSGANPLAKQMLTTIFNQLMDKQRDEYVQVGEYVRNAERQTQRNGYYKRSYTTRLGKLELNVPRTRDGQFSPALFERYQRNEKALIAAMLEMVVQGVSTRKVSKIVEELCGTQV